MTKYFVLFLVATTTLYTPAQAKGGKMPTPPVAYDYSREKAKDYKKDYCLDQVGNHVHCDGAKSGN